MRRYEKYKDSGVEWIGEIPEHWIVRKIKQITKILTGSTPKSTEDKYWNGEIFWVTTDDLGKLESKDINTSRRTITLEGFENSGTTIAPKNSIVLSTRAPIGHLGILRIEACTNQGCKTIVSSGNFNTEYLYYLLLSSKEILNSLGVGTTFVELPTQALKDFSILFPPLEEQTAIAAYLDQKTAGIDALITDKKRLLELYEEEKSAIINEAVTKGVASTRLASTRLASTGSAALGGGGLKEKKVLDETPALGGVKMKDSGIEWMGEIPAHWEMKRLRHVAKVQTGCTPLIQNSEIDYFENGTINWYTPSDFHSNDELSISKRQINKKAVEDGQVILFPEYSIYLVSIGATLGKVSFTKETASANQQINVITFYETMLNPIFGYFFFIANKENIKLEADYTTLPILNQSKAKNLLLACPPVEEQKEIAQYIEAETKRIDTKKEKTQKLIDLLTEYRTALISEVVTGKVKVV